MPRTWHDRHAVNKIEDDDTKSLYRSIVADKKPYFMRYIYPALMKQYNNYIKNTERNALREFQMTVSEMKRLPYEELTDRQKEFLRYYDLRIPVGVSDCVMNKICRRFENEFDCFIKKHSTLNTFDYQFMKSDVEYSYAQYKEIKKIYNGYNQRLRSYTIYANQERIDAGDLNSEISIMNDEFKRDCNIVCPNKEVLCGIILDICYTKNSTKRFAWSMCGAEIIQNLLAKNDYTINFPTLDKDGDIEYCSNKYSLKSKKVEVG